MEGVEARGGEAREPEVAKAVEEGGLRFEVSDSICAICVIRHDDIFWHRQFTDGIVVLKYT